MVGFTSLGVLLFVIMKIFSYIFLPVDLYEGTKFDAFQIDLFMAFVDFLNCK